MEVSLSRCERNGVCHMKRDTLDQCRTRGWKVLEQVWVSSLEEIRMGVWEHTFMCLGKNMDGSKGQAVPVLGIGGYSLFTVSSTLM